MVIVITGASRGIGAELALQMAGEGKHTLVLISRDMVALKEINKKIRLINTECICDVIQSDLSETPMIKKVADHIREKYDVVDILVNNAGFLINKSFESTTGDEIRKIIKINFLTPAILIQELIDQLKRAEIAHVINIGSMGGVQGSLKFPGLSFYSSVKGALATLTECLAEEYKSTGVKFNCLALGSADTDMFRRAFPDFKAPLDASEIASFIKYFAFTGQRYFNGKILPVAVTTP